MARARICLCYNLHSGAGCPLLGCAALASDIESVRNSVQFPQMRKTGFDVLKEYEAFNHAPERTNDCIELERRPKPCLPTEIDIFFAAVMCQEEFRRLSASRRRGLNPPPSPASSLLAQNIRRGSRLQPRVAGFPVLESPRSGSLAEIITPMHSTCAHRSGRESPF